MIMEPEKKIRFRREGTTYIEDFELAVSTLLTSQREKNPFISTTIELMKVIQSHLGHCQEILAHTEKLIEEARNRNASQDDIRKMADLCLEQQKLQVTLADSVVHCINQIVDSLFPR